MLKRIVSNVMLVLLVTSILMLAVRIPPVRASGTIYIRADGSIDPPAAPISTVDNVIYTLTGNITSDADGIVVERSNIIVDGAGYTVKGTGNGTGITLSGRSNVTIKNTKITTFYYYGTPCYGIRLDSSSNNTISGNNITNNGVGIELGYSSKYNTVSGNIITNNNYFGIELYDSSNFTSISGNTFTNDGLTFLYYSYQNYSYYSYQNSVESNTVNGRPLVYLEGVSDRTVDDAGQVILVRCENIRVEGLNLSRTDVGVILLETNNSTISGNNITNNYYGIWLCGSSNNSISGNDITNNAAMGIELSSSSNSSISGNNVANNRMGMHLESSSNFNSISGNTFTNDGLAVPFPYHNSVESNTVNGRPLVYLEGVSDRTVDDAGQVILVRCENIRVEGLNLSRTDVGVILLETNNSTISGNNITNNNHSGIWLFDSSSSIISGNDITNNMIYGIELGSSSNSSISGNNITTNNYDGICLFDSSSSIISGNNITNSNHSGIWLFDSSNNTLSRNNITANNMYGIVLDSSDNNVFYHNNFINNTQHVHLETPGYANSWDDGYPSGGNYWSNYTGLDLHKGPYQNETGSDGMGDASYVIDANNTDSYPLMKPYPWGPHDAGVTYIGRCYEIGTGILIYPPRTVAGLNILLHLDVFVMNYGDYTEVLNLTLYANSTIVSQVSNVTLSAKNSTILDVLWDTSGFEMGNYTVNAYLKSVPGESDVKDNNYTDGWIKITIPGDLNGDGVANLADLVLLATHYGSKPGDPKWNANADIDDNGRVGLTDLTLIAIHYGQHYP